MPGELCRCGHSSIAHVISEAGGCAYSQTQGAKPCSCFHFVPETVVLPKLPERRASGFKGATFKGKPILAEPKEVG